MKFFFVMSVHWKQIALLIAYSFNLLLWITLMLLHLYKESLTHQIKAPQSLCCKVSLEKVVMNSS